MSMEIEGAAFCSTGPEIDQKCLPLKKRKLSQSSLDSGPDRKSPNLSPPLSSSPLTPSDFYTIPPSEVFQNIKTATEVPSFTKLAEKDLSPNCKLSNSTKPSARCPSPASSTSSGSVSPCNFEEPQTPPAPLQLFPTEFAATTSGTITRLIPSTISVGSAANISQSGGTTSSGYPLICIIAPYKKVTNFAGNYRCVFD